jgi:hypothetical protein
VKQGARTDLASIEATSQDAAATVLNASRSSLQTAKASLLHSQPVKLICRARQPSLSIGWTAPNGAPELAAGGFFGVSPPEPSMTPLPRPSVSPFAEFLRRPHPTVADIRRELTRGLVVDHWSQAELA